MLTKALRTSLPVLMVLLLAGTAFGQAAEIYSGQMAKGSLDAPGMWDAYRFEGIQNDQLTLKVLASRKTSLRLVVRLLGPEGRVALPGLVNGNLRVRKMSLPASGLYFLVVQGEWPTIGDYKLKLKLKRAKFPNVGIAVPGEVQFTAPHGALLTVRIKAVKGSELEPGVDSVENMDGENALVPAALSEKGPKATVKKLLLPTFDQHRIVIVGRNGTTGDATVKLRIKPPKKPERVFGSRGAFHTMVAKIHHTEAGATQFGYFVTEVVALDTVSAMLRFPATSALPDLVLTGTAGNAQEPGVFVHEEYFDTEGEMDAAFPDGHYTILLTRGDGAVSSFPLYVGDDYPSDATITSFGTAAPILTWSGCEGAQFITIHVRDAALDSAVLVSVLPGDAKVYGVPQGVIQGGREYQIEVRGYSRWGKQVLTTGRHVY